MTLRRRLISFRGTRIQKITACWMHGAETGSQTRSHRIFIAKPIPSETLATSRRIQARPSLYQVD